MSIDQSKLEELIGRAIVDFGGAYHAGLAVIGDKLGLYKALADNGPMTPAELAEKTGTAERYVREWASCQAAGGYVTYDPDSGKFSLSPEQALAFADETSPAFLPGAFQVAVSAIRSYPEIEKRFRTGDGFGWHQHDHGLFEGTERFFRPSYIANLTSGWIPSLDGVVEKLEEGALVADVGCGHGASTILMAKTWPNSTFIGYDYHGPSVERARQAAEKAGVSGNTSFEVAASKGYPGTDYDLVTFFDCLHDMGDPVGASAHVLKSLAPDGTWMIVEPYANDKIEDNINPVGRAYYGASTLICTPASLDQEVGLALGAQAGEARIKDVVTKGGFTRFRRASETPFNLVFEARP
ncbi:MAG TPA: methyltransferase domain-containing protein [Thermodesulfobacteriota bacterium]|nr:methyltransferase domain-containing protein [Thermodesulfobacteriota bacterium]